MKNIYLLTVLLCTKIIFAQTYIPFPNDSATWVVNKYCNSPCNFFTDNQPQQIVQHGDSIKSGILYHKLYSVFSGTNSPTFFCFYREFSKKIYCKYPLGTIFGNDTSEFVLYDFNLNVGDTFTIKSPTVGLTLTPPIPKMRLNSITTTTVSYVSGLRTAYSFSSVSTGGSYGLNLFITWYEGIGANQGFLYNLAYRGWPILTPSSYPYTYNLNCFYRSNSFIYNPTCIITNLNKNTTKDVEVLIYPNPTNGNFTLKLDSETETKKQIELTNLLGEIIFKKEIHINETQININNFDNGVYFLKVFDKNKLIGTTKIVKQ